MPLYDYECRTCNGVFETYQSIHAEKLERCNLCGAESVDRLINPPIIIDRTPKTFGTLAEKNTRLLGSGERSEREAKCPSERVPDRSLSSFTPAERDKYIMEGKRPIGK